jgi:DNA gyrase/topoisomerase IV subunit B
MTEQFKKLTDYQHARQRTEMYLGSREPHTQAVLTYNGTSPTLVEHTWVPALYTGFRELIDNALDEMVGHGHGGALRVFYDASTGIIEVQDDGRGLPLDEKSELGKGPAASILLGEARAGRNFDQRGAVAGVNGLGAAVVNFTSEWFELEVCRDEQRLFQTWEEGTYRQQDIHKTQGPTLVAVDKSMHGTRVRFKPSSKVYPKMILPLDFIRSRMWDIALANPGLSVTFNDEPLQVTGKDPVATILFATSRPSVIAIKTERVNSRFYVVPGIVEDEHVHSLVNNIPVFQGGPHIEEFRSLFYSTLIDLLDPQAKAAAGFKGKDQLLSKNDLSHGLLIYNITVMNDPHFDGQTKTRLVSEIKPDIRRGFMVSDVKAFIRNNPTWVAEVIQRCVNRVHTSTANTLRKEQKKLSKTKIASLKDATGSDRTKCILFIAEGESAISGMMSVRDATIHGGIGLRGKIMNVHSVVPKEVLASKALTDIMHSIGLKLGERANPMHLRYGRVYIATDEDEDGKNITALIVNFLYTFWPELFQDPKNPIVYKFSTPLIILVKGKDRKYIYADGYENFNSDEWAGWQIIRAKGLARLTQPDWKIAIYEPNLVPMIDDGRLKETLDLLFNKARADDRKEWLSS